jgi:UrcA family protein
MLVASSIPRAALTLAICAAAVSAATPAAAGEPRKIRIPVERLDLTAPDDVAVLNARVVQAARAVCRRPHHAAEPVQSQSACVADAVRRAWVQIEEVDALERAGAAQISGPRAR